MLPLVLVGRARPERPTFELLGLSGGHKATLRLLLIGAFLTIRDLDGLVDSLA